MKRIKEWLINNAIVLFLAVVVIIILSSLSYISVLRNQNSNLSSTIVNLQNEFTQELNRKGDTIYIQRQTILTQRQAIETGLLENEELRANNIKLVQSQVRLEERISNLQTIIAGFDDHTTIEYIEVEGEIDNEKWLKMPAYFSYTSEWINFRAAVQYPEGLILRPGDLSIISKPVITIGERNKYDSRIRNFFSTPDKVVIYQNENPHVEIVGMENIIIEQEKRFYQRWWFWTTIGVAAGVIIAN